MRVMVKDRDNIMRFWSLTLYNSELWINTVNLFFSGSQQLLISLIEIKNLIKNLLIPTATQNTKM